MKLSAPIFRLKHQAKRLSRDANIPLNEALDRIAGNEGFRSWSLLAAHASAHRPSSELLARLKPGELVLLGARPGHGKTLMGLELIAEAIKAGRKGMFFTLEYHEKDVAERFHAAGGDPGTLNGGFQFDCSDAINADYIIDRLADAAPGTLAVIDYLQLLDQKRENPPLSDQVAGLKAVAKRAGVIVVCISQIDRSFESSGRSLPDVADVRLPNPLDLTLFDKKCFMNDGEMRVLAAR